MVRLLICVTLSLKSSILFCKDADEIADKLLGDGRRRLGQAVSSRLILSKRISQSSSATTLMFRIAPGVAA